MNLITNTFNQLKNVNTRHRELKFAQSRLINNDGFFHERDIDLVVNHYQEKIAKKYPKDIQNRKPILHFIEGDKIKITQSVLKNNFREITQILAYLKNNNSNDTRKIAYLADNFSKRALNILKNTLNTDIHTISNPKEYNYLGIVHAVFDGNEEKISETKSLIDRGFFLKENGGSALINNNYNVLRSTRTLNTDTGSLSSIYSQN